VEQQVQLHPAIQECAVVGHPDPNSGETVWLYAVKRAEVSKTDLFEHCRARLASYKCPKKIIFLDALPKSSVGKILKRELQGR
jgi:long-chain acyl-CoA synthetase